mmetsp:Transcript_24476/g.38156  ORF Transcript_24476/g.38156 Transcript_24476/m.38156 type:complete len:404 (-) Transcript_24476:52-1263(-)
MKCHIRRLLRISSAVMSVFLLIDLLLGLFPSKFQAIRHGFGSLASKIRSKSRALRGIPVGMLIECLLAMIWIKRCVKKEHPRVDNIVTFIKMSLCLVFSTVNLAPLVDGILTMRQVAFGLVLLQVFLSSNDWCQKFLELPGNRIRVFTLVGTWTLMESFETLNSKCIPFQHVFRATHELLGIILFAFFLTAQIGLLSDMTKIKNCRNRLICFLPWALGFPLIVSCMLHLFTSAVSTYSVIYVAMSNNSLAISSMRVAMSMLLMTEFYRFAKLLYGKLDTAKFQRNLKSKCGMDGVTEILSFVTRRWLLVSASGVTAILVLEHFCMYQSSIPSTSAFTSFFVPLLTYAYWNVERFPRYRPVFVLQVIIFGLILMNFCEKIVRRSNKCFNCFEFFGSSTQDFSGR